MRKLLLKSLQSLFMGSFLMLAFASWNTVLGQTTVTTDKDDYAPGEYVKISGTGWEPGERVDFHFEETPKPETCANSHDNFAIADANGNIYYGGFLIKENHLGVHFVLTATGLTSGLIATTEFTDDASLVVGGNASLPTLLNITADRAANAASPVYTSLGNVIVREANGSSGRNDFTTSFNQIVLTAPIGWEYKTTGIGVSVTPNSGIRDVASVSILSSTTSTITISVSVTSSGTANTNTNDQITISGVEVRSTNGNSLPNSGSIVLGFTGTLESLTSPQNIVSLSQVAGALNNFFVESSAGGNIPNQTTGTAFNIKITARDQFNNTVTSFSGNPNDVAISSNATLTSGSGNTSNFSNGVLSSHSVTINPAFIAATITATKSSVTGTSNAFNVTGGTIGSVSVGTQSGASVYGTASSPTYSITSLRGSSGTVTGTYTVSGLPAGVSGGFSSNASFTANGPNVFPGATLTLSVGASVAAGSYNFTVALTENANSANRATTTGTLVVGKAGSTISVNAAGPFTFNNNPQGPDAVTKSGSAGSVTFSYVGVLPTTYAASAIKPTNAGSYQVTATVAEDDNFFGKSSSPFNFTINKANQTITVTTASPASAIFNTTFTVAATASSGLSVGYTSSAPLSNVDGLYTMNSGVGTGVVKYNQAGNDNYNAAPEVNEFVAAAKADQTITVTTASPASAIFNTTFTVAASASSSLAVVYTSTAPLSNVAGLYTMNSGIGTGVVKYNQSGNDNYNAAPEVTANVAAAKANQTITVVTPSPASAVYNTQFTVAATASSGLAIAYKSTAPLSNVAGLYTMNSGVGTGVVKYNQAGNDNYNAAPEVTANVAAAKADQTITVTTASPASAIFNITFTVAASASSSLAVVYTSTAPLSNVAGLYTMNSGIGTGVVKYNQAGNDNYNAAPEVTADVAAAKADQTITVTTASPASAIFNTTFTVAASASSSLAVVYTSTAPLSNVDGLYTMNSGIGTGVVKYNQSGNDNYNAAPEVTANVAAVKAESTISVNAAGPFTYNGSQQGPDQVTKTGSSGAVTFSYVGVPATTYAASATKPTNAGSYSVVATVAADDNYNAKSSVAYGFAIGKKALTITADDQTKFAGQANPTFTVSYSVFVQGESAANLGGTLGFATAATVASCAGLYDVMPSGLTSSNYQITFIDGTLTVTGLAIDASASSTPVALGSSATLRSIVSPAVSGVSVSFYLDDVLKGSSLTIGDGTATLIVSGLAADVYQVKAVVGGGCSISEVVFLPVYDPAGGFVTGGGWIDSPVGAMTGDKVSAVGKANFGFNAKYKTGKNNTSEVDGNTNFQFKAGDLHFSSATHDNMQLVISGAKATYTGTGTVNGVGNHKFRVVAIDGQVSGGGGFDKFRIMIWDNNSSSTLLYDNKRGKSESSDDATVLGGGSIVIHKPAANGNKRVVTDLITVAWNTPVETIKKKVDQMGATWFESRKLAMTLNATAYDQLTPGFYELKADVVANEFFALDEPIAIQILVQDKPKALDVTISNDKLVKDIRSGQVVGVLSTIDAVDNIHTYTIAANADLILDGNKLIWKGTSIPARLDVTVFSTDRAGQTISREITLSRELKPGEFFLYPNPASSQTNVMVDLDQSATVAIRIFDAIGRLVVENEASRSGSFTQAINLDGLAAGMYTVQVNVGNMVMTKRLIKK